MVWTAILEAQHSNLKFLKTLMVGLQTAPSLLRSVVSPRRIRTMRRYISSDPDGSVLTYALKEAADPYFFVDASSGAVYVKTRLNAEALRSNLVLQANVIDLVDGFTNPH